MLLTKAVNVVVCAWYIRVPDTGIMLTHAAIADAFLCADTQMHAVQVAITC